MGQAKIFNSFIAIDFEYLIIGDYTTACQIGMIKCVQREIIDEYIEIIRPPHTNGPLAPNNSIKIEQTETALTFIEQYDKIRDFMEDLPLVAHNKSTEINILNKCCELYNLPSLTQGKEWFDTYTDYTNAGLSLSCHKLGIKLGHHHDAGCDARACCQIYLLYCSHIPMPYISQEERKAEKKGSQENYFRQNCEQANKDTIKEITSKENRLLPTQLDLFGSLTDETTEVSHILAGRKIVITGFDRFEKKRLKERIEEIGGIVIGNVSKNVSYVFMGENPGKSKTEEIAKLIHNGYAIQTILREDIELILNGTIKDKEKYVTNTAGIKNLDFTIDHFRKHHMRMYLEGEISIFEKKEPGSIRKEFYNPFSMKCFYLGKELMEDFYYLAQLIGNLGGYVEKEITTDTQVCILSDSTLKKLEYGEKDDTILYIQNYYNNTRSVTFDMVFVSLSEVLSFILIFINKFQERSTTELYDKYIRSKNIK